MIESLAGLPAPLVLLVAAVLLVTLGHVAGSAVDQVRMAVGLVGPPLLVVAVVVHFGRGLSPRR